MIQKNDQRIIIASLAFFLLASFIFLACAERRQHNYDHQKNWWILYFENPKDSSLDFIIENHSDKNNFHWEVLVDDVSIDEENINIPKGEKEIVVTDEIKDKKVIIRVSDGKDKKEIYKTL